MRPARTSSTFRGCTPRLRSLAFSRPGSRTASRRRVPARSSGCRPGARSSPDSYATLKIFAVADEVDEATFGDKLDSIRPDLVVSCGDLPFDYLEFLVSRIDVPLLYVPGNHDPSLASPNTGWMAMQQDLPPPGPEGADNIDGRVTEYRGLRIAGLGGSLRYKDGP